MNERSPASPFRILPWVTVAVLLALVVGFRVALEISFADRIYPGVQAIGLDLGGKTTEQAASELQAKLDGYGNQSLTVVAGDQTLRVPIRELGFKPDANALASAAYQAGRTGDVLSHLGGPLVARDVALPLPASAVVDDTSLSARMAAIGAQVNRPAVDANLVLSPAVTLTPSQSGQTLDQAKAVDQVRGQLAQFQTDPIDLPVTPLPPRVTTEQLAPMRDQANQILAQPAVLSDGQHTWSIGVDALRSALVIPKDANTLDVTPGVFADQVATIAQQVDRAPVDARLSIADGQVSVSQDNPGVSVDQPATLAAIRQGLLAGTTPIAIVTRSLDPAVPKSALDPVAADAQKRLDKGLVLTAEGQSWQLGPSDVGDLLQINRASDGSASYALVSSKVADRIAQIDQGFKHPSQEARFAWNNGQVSALQPNVPAVGIDEPAAVKVVLDKWQTGQVELPLAPTTMQLDDAYLARLSQDLKGVIQTRDTSFAGSIPERAHNIGLALSRINGSLVAPGQVFSFNKALGPTTLASGFQWGFGYTTNGDGSSAVVPSVAGGICQVATTLFQPVFFAGYEIEERHWHMFPMAHYVDNGYIGLDATVSPDDGLDFQFMNDTDHALLIVAGVKGNNAEIQLIGTQPDWSVKVDPEKITDIQPAPTTKDVTQSPLFAKGRQIILEEAQQGLTSHVVRHVTYPDGHERTLNMTSNYQPSQLSILVGTG
jgi:vancomycin resistance protein YoaR